MSKVLSNMSTGEPLLHGLSPPHCDALRREANPRTVPKGDVLFVEGAAGSRLYVLEVGAVQLHKTAEDGREVPIRVVRPGELFGEVVLFETPEYPVTATAIRPSEVLAVESDRLQRLLEDRAFRNDFIRFLLRKQRYLADRIRELTSVDSQRRLLAFLAELSGGREEFAVSMRKRDVAVAINTTPENLSRLVARLSEQGLLEWRKGRVRLKQPP